MVRTVLWILDKSLHNGRRFFGFECKNHCITKCNHFYYTFCTTHVMRHMLNESVQIFYCIHFITLAICICNFMTNFILIVLVYTDSFDFLMHDSSIIVLSRCKHDNILLVIVQDLCHFFRTPSGYSKHFNCIILILCIA